MSGPVGTRDSPREKGIPSERPAMDAEDDGKEGSEDEKYNGKVKEKSEEKDSKAWQQDGDFAYEYVQLAQVRYAIRITLHLPITSSTGPGCFSGHSSRSMICPSRMLM